jgi:hypothetical protein
VFPGLPLQTIMGLSGSSRDCRLAARRAIPGKQAAMIGSISRGSKWATPGQVDGLKLMLQRLAAGEDVASGVPFEPLEAVQLLLQRLAAGDESVDAQDAGFPLLDWKRYIVTAKGEILEGLRAPARSFVKPPEQLQSLVHPGIEVSIQHRFDATGRYCFRVQFELESWVEEGNLRGDVDVYALGSTPTSPGLHSVGYFGDMCKDVELLQALHLVFQSACEFKKVLFDVPAKSPSDFAAVAVDSGVLLWNADEDSNLPTHGLWMIGQGPEVTIRACRCRACGWDHTCA